jgi:hypothetical protein
VTSAGLWCHMGLELSESEPVFAGGCGQVGRGDGRGRGAY